MKSVIFIGLLLSCFIGGVSAQTIYSTTKQGNIWMMNDSLGLDFNYSPPKPFHAPIPFPDFAIATLCDTFGRLKYFDKVHNGVDQIVMNRDSQWIPNSINPTGNYQAITWFLPYTGTQITGYVTFDGDFRNHHYGMGRVIYNRLLDTLNQGKGNWYGTMNHIISDFDSMRWWSGATVRHANGRDWWVASHRHGDDTIFVMLATPDTMKMVHRLRLGSDNCVYSLSPTAGANGGEMIFSPDGSRLLNVNGEGLVEVYDFDRCTGIVSNPLQIEAPLVQNGVYRRLMYSVCFSASGRFIYISQLDMVNNIVEFVQYDLLVPSPGASRTIIYTVTGQGGTPMYSRLGPDKKIYVVQGCDASSGNPCNQMDSSYMAIINYPDTVGLACQLVFNAVSMGRFVRPTYFTMAPNYDLGPIDGSPCDTLGIDTRPADPDTTVKINALLWPEELRLYPNPVEDILTLESRGKLLLHACLVYDMQGRVVLSEKNLNGRNIWLWPVQSISRGQYLLEVVTDQGVFRRPVTVVGR